jgi:copper chaperone CopZ
MKKAIAVFPILALLLLIVGSPACAQKKEKTDEVKIKVFFHCPNGKALIERELIKEPGVKEVYADLETKVVTVKYVSKETSKDNIVAAIEKIGYYTEFTPADKKLNKACSHGDHQEGEEHKH